MNKFFSKIINRERSSSDSYIRYLRKKGMSIGNNTTIYSPKNTIIDETRPWLIKIGNGVNITDGVRILTHDYSWSVIKGKYGDVLGSSGKVTIGDNVFIGVNTTILKGVTISSNIIIGANSLVSKSLSKEGVYAGSPARYIMSLDEYRDKRKSRQFEEAYEMAVSYYECYNKWPSKDVFREFFWLFDKHPEEYIKYDYVMKLQGNDEDSYRAMREYNTRFESFSIFMSYIKDRYKKEN